LFRRTRGSTKPGYGCPASPSAPYDRKSTSTRTPLSRIHENTQPCRLPGAMEENLAVLGLEPSTKYHAPVPGTVPTSSIIQPKPLWTGKQILSMTIPRGVNISRAQTRCHRTLCLTMAYWSRKANLFTALSSVFCSWGPDLQLGPRRASARGVWRASLPGHL
jgi:hypothetical protein